jgi:hypothetical protein
MLMLFKETLVFSENHMRPINPLWRLNALLFFVESGGNCSHQRTLKCKLAIVRTVLPYPSFASLYMCVVSTVHHFRWMGLQPLK